MIRRYYKKKQIPEYKAYYHIKSRCLNTKDTGYVNYGGRGIALRFDSFDHFYNTVGRRPSPKHSIERVDNDGHYEPGNVRWATRREQNLNQRLRKDNSSGFRGVTKYLGVGPRKWMAYIRCDDRRLHIGNFRTALEAAYVRDQFALQIYGNGYRTNVLEDYLNIELKG